MNNAQELRAEVQAKLKSDALNRVLASNNSNLLECRKWKTRCYMLIGSMILLLVTLAVVGGSYYRVNQGLDGEQNDYRKNNK